MNSKDARCIAESQNMARKRSRDAPLICTIDVTGFAAIMLALLAMFMGPIMFGTGPPIHPSVDLAKARHAIDMPGADREDASVIGIARDGKLYLGADPIELDQMEPVLRDRLSDGPERKVYLKVDRAAKYGVVVKVLAKVRAAGVENIAFLVEKYPPPTM